MNRIAIEQFAEWYVCVMEGLTCRQMVYFSLLLEAFEMSFMQVSWGHFKHLFRRISYRLHYSSSPRGIRNAKCQTNLFSLSRNNAQIAKICQLQNHVDCRVATRASRDNHRQGGGLEPLFDPTSPPRISRQFILASNLYPLLRISPSEPRVHPCCTRSITSCHFLKSLE